MQNLAKTKLNDHELYIVSEIIEAMKTIEGKGFGVETNYWVVKTKSENGRPQKTVYFWNLKPELASKAKEIQDIAPYIIITEFGQICEMCHIFQEGFDKAFPPVK